ncbi:MAG: PAS domain S-box protein, partial [Sandaracinaceae bacterium]|nr:PAS domain S-box protein [Sandaracinaceae bacterium]
MALFQADEAARLLSVDEAWARRIGVGLGDKWTLAVCPEQRSEIEALWVRACAMRTSFEVKLACVTLHGVRTMRVRAEPATQEASSPVTYLGAVTLDEERHLDHEAILESVADGILVARAGGEIVVANDPAHAIFGYPPGEMIGLSVDALVPDAMRAEHRRLREHFGEHPRIRPMGERTLPGVRKDGSIVPVEIRIAPLRTPDGVCVSAVVRDVTRRAESEGDALLGERMRGIGGLIAMVRHEVNNPLTTILANLHLALDELHESHAMTASVEGALLDARLAAEQIELTVRELGTLAMSELGALTAVDPAQVLEQAIRLAGPAVSVSVPIERRLETSASVWASPVLLGQVFVNLLLNASEAMAGLGPGQRRIGVRIEEHVERVTIEISDVGPGVPVELLSRIFEPY